METTSGSGSSAATKTRLELQTAKAQLKYEQCAIKLKKKKKAEIELQMELLEKEKEFATKLAEAEYFEEDNQSVANLLKEEINKHEMTQNYVNSLNATNRIIDQQNSAEAIAQLHSYYTEKIW